MDSDPIAARVIDDAREREASRDELPPSTTPEHDADDAEREAQVSGFAKQVARLDDATVAALNRSILRGRLQSLVEPDLLKRELGLAQQFEVIAADRFLFSEAERLWLHYDEATGRWHDGRSRAREEAKALADHAVAFARRKLRAAIQNGTTQEVTAARAAIGIASALQRERTITAVLDAARTSPALRVQGPADFDREPHLFCAANGVIDLRDGSLLPHDAKRRMRCGSPVAYNPQAECPTWLRFLDDVTGGDSDYTIWLQAAVGYSLSGEVADELAFFMLGSGANGKSSFANVLQRVCGDYQGRIPSETLMASRDGSRRESATPVLASIVGKRIVFANEVESGARLSANQLKILVSTEAITARKLYGEPFEFAPTHKIWIRGNNRPVVSDADDGTWRRLLLLPFDRQFKADEADPLLGRKLLAEASGILRWAAIGAARWYEKYRLPPPPAVVARASADYRADSDLLGQWLAERCCASPELCVLASVAYDDFRAWSESHGVKALSQPALSRRLEQLGIRRERRRVGGAPALHYVGVALSF